MVDTSPALKSWIGYDEHTHFPLENIPFGVFTNPKSGHVRCCTRIGDFVIDLSELEHDRVFDGPLFSSLSEHVFCESTLNKFAALGKAYRLEIRASLQKIFGTEGSLSAPL
jgi:fumarylacetoacetase